MVQNQMTPSYQQFQQTTLDAYQQTAEGAPAAPTVVTSEPQPFKDQPPYSPPTVTANGVEQQTVSLRWPN